MFFVSKKRLAAVTAKLADADRKLEVSQNNYKSLWVDYRKLQDELEKAKATVYKPVRGITEGELEAYTTELQTMYDAAHSRQKSADAKPSEFMRGLGVAIKQLDSYKPHELV